MGNYKKHILLVGLLALSVLLLASCGARSGADSGEAQKITAEEAKKLMEGGDVTIVDVRRPDEYEAGHIPDAINVPNEEISDTRPAALPDLEATLLVYCRTGVRSAEASAKLMEIGYTDVRDLGGIVDWPYETVTGSGEAAPVEQTGILSSFTAVDLDGNDVDQSIFSDYKLTMVNVWATFCSPCINEMPELGELAEEYADKDVQIVGIVSDALASDGTISEEMAETAREIVEQTGANYPHLLPAPDLFNLLYQISSVPTTLFVDSEGRQVGSAYLGSRSKDKWSAILEQTLAEVAP